ncbi:MAG TPA: heme lyase CcmF/NrfE family subunit [Burkholderiales bacterium]|nr:heme lyase CcmF/NrfE family subunit [Burkholderiales bacterium]
MIPELGQVALSLALALALFLSATSLYGAEKSNAAWISFARPSAQGLALLVAFAFGCLVHSFVVNDFSVAYVAMNSNSALPLHYRVAGAWGGHEGSLLLWALMLGVWMSAVSLFSRHLPDEMTARVLGVMGLISAGFLAFMLFTSNPFDRMLPAAADGRDLNPLLQDPGMVLHPPMLYMGYVGFSVAFSFAVAALLAGRLDATWARWSRPWTTVAWMFLTVGIALGSGWAYYELGWGGWWFWDPVENASFMPWLCGTALIHSLAVTEKRGAFRSWTVLLAIFAFALSLLGTFLVRSGVLTSVHAFAVDPKRGVFILALFALLVGGALALYAWRTARIGLGGGFSALSRESFLLANNVLLGAAAGTVFLGTLYPLALDALGAGKISVGPPYFETVFVPLMAPALFLMGIGPLARWKRSSLPELAVLLRWALAVSLALGLLLPLAMGSWKPMVGFGLSLALWVILSALVSLRKSLRQTRSHYGMVVAHIGVAVFVIGVTLVKGYEVEKDARMRPGERVEVAGYVFLLEGVANVAGPNYQAARAKVSVSRNGSPVSVLHPERRLYTVQQNVMTEAAINTGLTRDLYVSLGDPLDGGAWLVKMQVKPFIDWIWGGCLIMALGGLLAASDRRYRFALKKESILAEARA